MTGGYTPMISPAVLPTARCWQRSVSSPMTRPAGWWKGWAPSSGSLDRGEFIFDDSLEDIHMHIEARLLQVAGKVAQKLHTARSRNDQVALDVRMYLREETRRTIACCSGCGRCWWTWPAATRMWSCRVHPHPAGPAGSVCPSHDGLLRNVHPGSGRFSRLPGRIDVMPLGAAALAGTTYPIDQARLPALLDFPGSAPTAYGCGVGS
jgi:argininosuccinate lyase